MKKLKSALVLGIAAVLLLPALGNQLLAAQGQIIMEDLTPSQLRGEIKKIETEFYHVFNASTEDEDLAVIFYDFLPTGSNIKQDICEPQFAVDKRADNANDSRLGIDVLLTPQGLQRDLALEYEALTAAMTKAAQESEYFRELNNILGALREELESR